MPNIVKNDMELSHVALLVPSLERSLAVLAPQNFCCGNIEIFHEKGDGKTREVYIHNSQEDRAQLLLVESLDSRWFSQFFAENGNGLHHVAINVPSLMDYCHFLYQKGWYLHTCSIFGYQNLNTVYVVKPGISLMLEVQLQPKSGHSHTDFITEVFFQVHSAVEEKAIADLGIEQLHPIRGENSYLKAGDKIIDINGIINS